jgi:hypothetical protein
VSAVARVLLVARPELALGRHDITAGRVRRTVRTGRTILEDETIDLTPGCVSCTLREDILPTGEVSDAEFIDCVRTSLPYAWELVSRTAADLDGTDAEFADNQIPPVMIVDGRMTCISSQ